MLLSTLKISVAKNVPFGRYLDDIGCMAKYRADESAILGVPEHNHGRPRDVRIWARALEANEMAACRAVSGAL